MVDMKKPAFNIWSGMFGVCKWSLKTGLIQPGHDYSKKKVFELLQIVITQWSGKMQTAFTYSGLEERHLISF